MYREFLQNASRRSIIAGILIHESNDAVAKQVQTKLNGYDMVECISVKKC